MKSFLKSKPGVLSVIVFTLIMAVMVHRVIDRRQSRGRAPRVATAVAGSTAGGARQREQGTSREKREASGAPLLAENAAYLERYYELGKRAREDHDRQGNPVTRRETSGTPAGGGRVIETVEPTAPTNPPSPARTSLRLQGRTGIVGAGPAAARQAPAEGVQATLEHVPPIAGPTVPLPPVPAPASARYRPQRFNPFGRVIKCELVFTIDSVNEQSPLIGVVMEPVYNNGSLVIPAGAELHGVARPDRLRDRIFAGQEWVLVFPREPGRPNGRQLNVKGAALDRVEPDANGMTWGMTDGSYGLEGQIIRTMNDEEIKRFVSTFLAAGATALQERQTDRGGQQTARNTPQNAVLQGLAANFEKISQDISAEIAQHGVFIRVAAGHQFYFYPMQIIDPDAADISSDIATVK